jgi:hypothetical protein
MAQVCALARCHMKRGHVLNIIMRSMSQVQFLTSNTCFITKYNEMIGQQLKEENMSPQKL